MRFKFIVPAEGAGGAAQAQRGRASRNLNRVGPNAAHRRSVPVRLVHFAFWGKLVQHVGEGFGVHQAVFDGDLEQQAGLRMAARRRLRPLLDCRVECFAQAIVVRFNLGASWPVAGLIVGQASTYRVDAEGKQPVERGMKARQTKHALREEIPVEGFQVAQIKNNPVALGNRAVVNGFGPDNAE